MRESNQAVARGIIMRNMLVACLGTFRALSSARLLLRKRCQERVKRVRGQTGRVSQCRAEYRVQNSRDTTLSV